MLFLKLLVGVISSLSFSYADSILFMIPIAGKSHKIFFDSIIAHLAHKGHNITVFSQYQPTTNDPKVKNIFINSITSENAVKNAFEFTNSNPVFLFASFKPFLMSGCVTILEHPEFKAIVDRNQEFDAVILSSFMNECSLMVSPLLSKVLIQVATGPGFPWMFPSVTKPTSFVPNSMWKLTDEMTLMERAYNTINTIGLRLLYRYYLLSGVENIVKLYYPNALAITEAEEKVSLVLQNADPVLTGSNPKLPNIVDVGGIHCREAKPIPKDLDEFISNSGHRGFILFSLGANLKSKFISSDKIQNFLRAFARLEQKVIWKFEDDLLEIPENVLVRKWLPQQDLLGDPRIRLFITHGGLLSLQEAVYHEVPVIGIPIFSDQPGNVARVVQLHIGELLQFNDITEESLFEKITTVLGDKSYATNVTKYSSIFRNLPEKPIDRASFWIEYAMRHGDESFQLRANNRFSFLKYYLIDVIIAIAALSVIVCLVVKKVVGTFL